MRLLAAEIERFSVWYKPTDDGSIDLGNDGSSIDRDIRLMKQKLKTTQEKLAAHTEKEWKVMAGAAWKISPYLACHLPSRLKQEPVLIGELIRLVRSNPEPAHLIPEAIKFLATQECVKNDGAELGHLLTWAVADPAQALSFFSQLYKPNPYTAQYAVKCLRSFNADQILFYIPQLVQALRYDTIGYVFEYLIWSSNQSPLLCHQLMWNMMTNRFRDEEGTVKDPDIGFKIDALLDAIKGGFDIRAAEFYKREFKFAGDLTEISNRIKPFDKDNGDRKQECKESRCSRQQRRLTSPSLKSRNWASRISRRPAPKTTPIQRCRCYRQQRPRYKRQSSRRETTVDRTCWRCK